MMEEDKDKDNAPIPQTLVENRVDYDDTRLFRCTLCPSSFSKKAGLGRHQRMHLGEAKSTKSQPRRPDDEPTASPDGDAVPSTGYSPSGPATKKQRLNDDILRPFNCLECPSNFTTKSALNRHNKIHLGLKEFKCTHCPAAFNVKCNLIEHERIHLKDKPYPCPECPASFSRKTTLTKHEIAVHPQSLAAEKDLTKDFDMQEDGDSYREGLEDEECYREGLEDSEADQEDGEGLKA